MTDDDIDELDLGDEGDVDDDHVGGQSEYANLPDGQTLVTYGPGAGQVTNGTHEGAPAAPAIRSRDEALAGDVPLYVCLSGHRYHGNEHAVLATLHAIHGGTLGLGHSVRIPRMQAASNERRLDIRSVSVRIADPMGFAAFNSRLGLGADALKPTHLVNAPYLGKLTGRANTYAEELLAAQREIGANLLLTSGRAVDHHNISGSFEEIADELDECTGHLEGGERLGLNVTLPYEFLQNQKTFDDVMAELADLDDFDVLYIRAQRLPPSDPGAPLGDLDQLRRLYELGAWVANEGHTLIHAQTGLTGWLMLASGAVGFSSGVMPSDQVFIRQAGGGGGGHLPLERHFERCLLHTVSSATHDVLVAGGAPYVDWPTRWGTDALTASPYDQRLSCAHSLYSIGALAADTVPAATRSGGWAAGIHQKVHAAQAARTAFGLGGRENAVHLGSWINLV